MKWIDSTDLIRWANRRDCQETLPLLVRKLIRTTSKTIQSIKFPSGESILLGGWDGTLDLIDGTEYLPSGISLWEFGASNDPKGKADNDYNKRVSNPLGYKPAESTFVFVTPRLWKNGKDWAEDKRKDGIWKDIRVINSEILEEWIELAPTVGAWLAKKENIGKYPSEGIQPTDDFWEEWTSGTKFNLNAEILLGGRNEQQKKVLEGLKSHSIFAVQGISREESLAFIISCVKNNPEIEEDFFSRSIIVDNVESFRELTVQEKPLFLIPRFEDIGVVNRAVKNGHTVICPLGADSANNWSNKIILPQIDRESFVSAFSKIGIPIEIAERYSKESARNITILRRQLEFDRTIPLWALPENVNEIIPALIVGRWDENFENDRKIISKIAGYSYENYSKKITRWLHEPDSPIVKIGSTWRLTSPLDSWGKASINLTRNDFELLYQAAKEIISEINPAFLLAPEQRHMASAYGKNRRFSSWIREGVIQSLILTSIFGDKLKFNLPLNSELWVDKIVTELLSTDNPEMWKSFQVNLPLLAEASPSAFLEAVERLLRFEKSPIASLFEEDPGFLTSINYHTGLLWALENLSWFPQYLSRTSLILAKLSAIDPGGSLTNRPINSLNEIFKSWHYQTLATFEERMQVLKLISQYEPEIAWKILIRMLPNRINRVALYTNKCRWRMYELETEKPITLNEIYETHSAAIDMLISIFDFSEKKLSKLIDVADELSHQDRDKVLTFVENVLPKVKHEQHLAWHASLKILNIHRLDPDAEWAIPESEIVRFEKLYETLKPTNEIDNSIWLFNDHWPNFPVDIISKNISIDEKEKLIREKRIEALTSIYEKYGIEKIIELSFTVNESSILGETLSHIINEEEEIIKLCELLTRENTDVRFVYNYLFHKTLLNGFEWVVSLFKKLQVRGFNNKALSKLLHPLNQTQKLWNFIDTTNEEIISGYWRNIFPNFHRINKGEKIFGLKKLIEFKRFISAAHICSHFVEEIPSNIIIEILERVATEKSDEQIHLDSYKINILFETIDKRNNVAENTLIQLEWWYIHVLASHGNNRKPKWLHKELSSNPVFFIDILKWLYIPDDETKIQEQKNNLTIEQTHDRAIQAYKLLQSWKNIPGVDETGKIDTHFLKSWVSKVRELAIEYGLCEAADSYIGQVLAQYHEEEGKVWPPDEICELIETLNSKIVNNNFSSSTFNKRGSSARGVFDGGDIERKKAAYFNNLATAHKNKFPSITSIFEKLAKGFEEDAKRNDEEAERRKLEY